MYGTNGDAFNLTSILSVHKKHDTAVAAATGWITE